MLLIEPNPNIDFPLYQLKQQQAQMSSQGSLDSSESMNVENNMYVVEKILKKRTIVKHGINQVMYFVKWEGYPRIEDHTWEPIENLRSCPLVVEEFEKRLAAKNDKRYKYSQRRQELKGETINEKQIIKPDYQRVGSQRQPIQVDDRPMKHLKKHSQISAFAKPEKIDKPTLNRIDSQSRHHKQKNSGITPSHQADSQRYNQILKTYLPSKKQQSFSQYGKVVGHNYTDGQLWYQVEIMSKEKKVLKVQHVSAETAAKECMKNVHNYLQKLVKRLQQGYVNREF